ncbi:aconitase family protein [Verminephrobacter eiseniae]|uniref:aconitase family protein n=1 Tax=Verminephrobacter eiseniae TaxID=364317 RepID=UPI002238A92A|nr:aconitase family protein [Verminephrobacter eiseniae]MCW5231579.1 3-isopropylmalate dehydratase [Verminephrobacter eiseniae]MCW5293308.1 3-isopropylmalate dehydratase [Verminephrobacter eiseniae]MCW8187532.1 3-isopropylmalate dehydratase [Verminephrobacter eiseniae]MCW8225869.1 3-isopropylmalate dehydratase [Verminephrobacter eiseniae]MCW8236753.1 3-isopropylmalate dehydratase [Verminephrobacter eiseniae]
MSDFPSVAFSGRILFLCDNPGRITHQLAGGNLTREQAGALRDNVSTDEITPTTVMTVYDDRLADFPYVGYRAGNATPIGKGAVRQGGFAVVVGGKRYGKGSSRENSPMAEHSAGIRLVIAESFERIYRQNAHNVGLLTSTDLGLVERIQRGEAIPLAEFTDGHDELTQHIIRAGGLLAFSKEYMQGAAALPTPVVTDRPRSLARKIIDRNLVRAPWLSADAPPPKVGEGIFLKVDWRFSHEYFTGMAAHLMESAFGKPAPISDPSTIVAFQDHLTYVTRSPVHQKMGLIEGVRDLADGHYAFVNGYGVKGHGAVPGSLGSEGICHAMMAERYVLPGQVAVGTDSHTPHSGSLGALCFGAGATDMANAWVSGLVRCKYPGVCRVELRGELQPGVHAKDVVLELLRSPYIAEGGGIGMVFEYAGQVVERMSVDDRATLTNMVAELGGFSGIVAPDAQTVKYLKVRRGVDFAIEPWMRSDPDAVYENAISIDCSTIEPMFAAPGDPGNGVPYSRIGCSVPVDIAYGGSCTAGKRADFDEYLEVFSWGLQHGLKVPQKVSLFLQFGTQDVKRYCEEKNMLPVFEQAGAEMLMPGCGACANCGPGSSTDAGQVTVSAINRNFPGRSGPGQVWLASPASVAASALAGELITFAELKRRVAKGEVPTAY